jgi:phage terminase large subunit-like protein
VTAASCPCTRRLPPGLYASSLRKLEWPNGATAQLYNAVEPDQLRGPQHDAAWCDELAKWRYAQETWDQLQFGLRLGDEAAPAA